MDIKRHLAVLPLLSQLDTSLEVQLGPIEVLIGMPITR